MSIVEKLFHYNESQVNVAKRDDEIWFKGIANALGYENPGKAIRRMWILLIKCQSMDY